MCMHHTNMREYMYGYIKNTANTIENEKLVNVKIVKCEGEREVSIW